ncbi:SAM-dependent methyltransferase [Patescibacteria group bacterium]|nr:SAM-dependent methyltransferase [Patescibacteria group bacterium]MBU4511742.1 SAM-dependent methyltransferase [Patescibacteria group bacterium]MCG2692819.1 SAM-dependent methyltransferase [Candidatus Parcubacteria bacterium]
MEQWKPETWKSSYIEQFQKLRCFEDVWNIVSPIKKDSKEISESMSVVVRVRNLVLPEPGRYTVYDICAGNGLTGIIIAFLLPVKSVIAVDIRRRDRPWELARGFSYQERDLRELTPAFFEKDSIIVGVHACGILSQKIIELYNTSRAKHLILMPCCNGKIDGMLQFMGDTCGNYAAWSLQLGLLCKGKVRIKQDKKIISPKNLVITAHKER